MDAGADVLIVSHLGDGNVHYTVWPSKDDEIHKDKIMEAIENVVLTLGGSFSAEHGIGLSKLSSMERRKDRVALDVMRQIKNAIDPQGIMNPGKVLPKYIKVNLSNQRNLGQPALNFLCHSRPNSGPSSMLQEAVS